MTKKTVIHICDICNKEYDGETEIVKFSCSYQDFSGVYVGGRTYEFKEVCNNCTNKIKTYVEKLILYAEMYENNNTPS